MCSNYTEIGWNERNIKDVLSGDKANSLFKQKPRWEKSWELSGVVGPMHASSLSQDSNFV